MAEEGEDIDQGKLYKCIIMPAENLVPILVIVVPILFGIYNSTLRGCKTPIMYTPNFELAPRNFVQFDQGPRFLLLQLCMTIDY